VGVGTTSPGAKLNVVTSSSGDAVRITQTGAGNSFVVEDSTNPDASPFVINTTGNIISGYTSSINVQYGTGSFTPGTQIHGDATSKTMLSDFAWSAVAQTCPTLYLGKSRSATIGTPGVVSDGDTMGVVAFAGDDGTNFEVGAAILGFVDGTPGADDMPGRLVFQTTSDGSRQPTERMRIDSSGNIGIGTTTPACKLDVDGQIAGKYTAVGTNTAAQALATNKVSSVTISADTTLTTTVPPAGATACVIIVTSGSTSRTVTFGTGFASTGTLATGATASRRFVVSFVSDGTRLLETSRTTAITV